jgi:hypothetical protein
MDFHIPLIFLYAFLFIISFLALGIAMAQVQKNSGGKSFVFTFLIGVGFYGAASLYATESLKLLTFHQGWFVFGGAALLLLFSFFFKWQNWVLWIYSTIVVLTSLSIYLNWI